MPLLRYIFHFDELTWMPDVIVRPFNEMRITPFDRPDFLNWLSDNVHGMVYIWSGVITPDTFQTQWGNLISPGNDRTFIIFENDSDQTRFSLEFVGIDSRFKTTIHKDGFTAYYHVKNNK